MARIEDINQFSRIAKQIFGERWHYFNHHIENFTPFIQSVYTACLELNVVNEYAPIEMLKELYNLGGRENYEPHYDQLLQKLAELLVMKQVVVMPWPNASTFEIEAGVTGGRKKVDFVVTLPEGQKYGFEVKAPKYSKIARQRNERQFQFPVRAGDTPPAIQTNNPDNTILPRDNTLRSFLRSANLKFQEFKEDREFTGTLVVVWDDWIYEAIGPLLNERNGLLTEQSYSQINGVPETFKYVDSVILLRHLTYFVEAAAERPLPDGRINSMHVGGASANPNISEQISAKMLPEFVDTGFNAIKINHPMIEGAPEYHTNELVCFFN